MKANPIRMRFLKTLSLFLTAFLMAFVIWTIAINLTDPLEKRIFPNPIPLEVIGLDQNLILTSAIPTNVELILTAPQSSSAALLNGSQTIRSTVDLNGFSAGQYDWEVKIQTEVPAVRIEKINPRSIHVTLELKIN
jgi:YbbR domain-containing protein